MANLQNTSENNESEEIQRSKKVFWSDKIYDKSERNLDYNLYNVDDFYPKYILFTDKPEDEIFMDLNWRAKKIFKS